MTPGAWKQQLHWGHKAAVQEDDDVDSSWIRFERRFIVTTQRWMAEQSKRFFFINSENISQGQVKWETDRCLYYIASGGGGDCFISITSGHSSNTCNIVSPNKPLAQLNHDLVKSVALFLLTDSCIKPVFAVVRLSISRASSTSSALVDVRARTIALIGHTISRPTWGPPTPSIWLPLKNQGLSSDRTYFLVFRYNGSRLDMNPNRGSDRRDGMLASSISICPP